MADFIKITQGILAQRFAIPIINDLADKFTEWERRALEIINNDPDTEYSFRFEQDESGFIRPIFFSSNELRSGDESQ